MIHFVNLEKSFKLSYFQVREKVFVFGGRAIRRLTQAASKICPVTFKQLLNLAPSYLQMKNHYSKLNFEGKMRKVIHGMKMTFRKENTQETREESLLKKRQEAEKNYRQAEAAYAHLVFFRASGTLANLKLSIENFRNWIESEQAQAIPANQLDSFKQAMNEIYKFIEEEQKFFLLDLNKDQSYPNGEQTIERIHNMLQRVKDFYDQNVKSFSASLTRKSPEKQTFVKLAKVFADQVMKENQIYRSPSNKVYKGPSIDPTICSADENRARTLSLLKELELLEE